MATPAERFLVARDRPAPELDPHLIALHDARDPNVMSLNGSWRFRLSATADAEDDSFAADVSRDIAALVMTTASVVLSSLIVELG